MQASIEDYIWDRILKGFEELDKEINYQRREIMDQQNNYGNGPQANLQHAFNPISQRVELGGAPIDIKQGMNLKDHKRLTELAYSVRAFIDANGGLTSSEACFFGNIMSSIINLK